MSVPQPRSLATYNSLTDKHLAGYFSNARIRRHLQKSGLISKSGRIIPEKEYRLNAMRKDHQRYVQECLADAIFRKVLDMERHHQLEIKRKLEYSVRKEGMQKIKVEQFRGSLEDVIPMHSPHPPLGPRNRNGLSPLVAGERAARSQWRASGLGVDYGGGHSRHQHQTKEPAPSKVSSLRPNTAPGNMQQPPRLQPLHGWAAAGFVPKASKQKCHALEHDQQFAHGGERSELRLMNSVEYVNGVSPYQLPVINPCVAPVPPPHLRRGDRRVAAVRGGGPTGRRFRPTTAFNEQLLINNTRGFPKSPLCSNAFVTMVYLGRSKNVCLSYYKEEIKVYQQHCGSENICVYKGKLLEGDTFQFTSKRHQGFPFSLTFFINGIQVDRLSCCCEYKHQRRSRLRGRHRYFRVLNVEGAFPCYRCIIAMGLDKKLSTPKRKIEYHEERHVYSWEHTVHCEPSNSCVEQKSSKNSESVILPGHEASVETVDETLETGEEYRREEMENQSSQESEESQEDTSKNEYDEDFEADEEVDEEGQTGDQMNGMSESSSDDKNHCLDYGKESETSSQKAPQASGSEKDGSDGYSDRDSEDDQQERRPADSLSSMSTQCSTETDSHAEMMTDNMNGKEECNIKSTADSVAHVHYGNESGEKKLLRMEENQETSALEKKGIDEAEKIKPEDLEAREDNRISHENIMAMQPQNPEVNGESKQTGSGESNMNEEEKCLPVPWESRALNMEDGNEESPWCEEGGVSEDCKPVQEEIAKATGNDHPVNSDPEPGGSCASEEEKNAASTECDASGDGRRSLDVQEAAGQAVREGQVTGQRQALEQDGAAEGDAGSGEAGGKAARAGDSLPRADTGAVLEESAPEEGAVAEEHPKGKETGEAVKLGTEGSPGGQEVLVEGLESEVALGKLAPGGEGPAGALPGWETDTTVSQGQEGAGGITKAEEAAEKGLKGVVGLPAEEDVGEPVSEAGESLGERGSARKGTVVGAVSEGKEAVGDVDVAADGIARVVGPEGEEAVEEDISEGEEAVGKFGALWEALGDMQPGEAMPGEKGFVKPSEFSQLKVSGEEWMEMGKAVAGALALESAQAWEVGGNSLQRVEDTMEEPDKGPVLEVAPGLGALRDARGYPVTEGSSQVEESAAEALRSGNPSAGSKAETEIAVEGKPEEEVVGGSAGAAGAGPEGEEEATDGAAGSKEPAAETEGWLRCGKVRAKGRSPGEGVLGEAALPPPGLSVTRAGEPGLVAIAVVGGQAGRGALAGEPALARGSAVAGGGGVGAGAMTQEGVIGAVLGAQSGTGAAVAEEVSAKGRGAVGESGRDGEGVADGSVAGGREVNQEAAVGCEGRGPMPAAVEGQCEAEREWGAVRLVSPRHREVLGTMSLREEPTAETCPSTPAHGDGGGEPRGKGFTGGEGLCLGTQPQLLAPPETGTARGKDGRQEEGMEQARVKAEGEQASPCENTGESEVEDVSASAGSAAGAGEQRKDSPGGGSPGVLGAADVGDRSRSPRQVSPAWLSRCPSSPEADSRQRQRLHHLVLFLIHYLNVC
ncbi:glutamate-rich protein 3 isoform X3 [Corvus kubaryi]|uniref:glutamate-rich protein 3 isoform X3 n=1 Tax=Corvus kubaryi TaxID=68294 RepID=UPI001C055DDF|nr:glutamate-rich protein 3 isoform X3 [Corvus kubaryi]